MADSKWPETSSGAPLPPGEGLGVRVFATTECSPQELVLIPSTPIKESLTWGSRMWQLRRAGESVVFEGRSFFWHIVVGLLLVPVVYGVCAYCQASANLQFGLTLFPLFYAGGMAVGILVVMRVPKLQLELKSRSITLPHGAIISFDRVVGIQVIEGVAKSMENDSAMFRYQVNLCYRVRKTLQRLNLVQCQNERATEDLAKSLGNYLKAPVCFHFLPKNIIEDHDQHERRTERGTVLVMGLFFGLFAGATVMAMLKQMRWTWKDPLWLSPVVLAVLLGMSLLAIARRRKEHDRRVSRSVANSLVVQLPSPGTRDQ